MYPFQIGSTLLQKYRIDRFRKREDGVHLYEGIDASHLRRVCIKVLAASTDAATRARFHDEAHAANVIDLGRSEGLPYFVTTECELVPPAPRPKTTASKPPPLPKPKPPPLPEIPIYVEVDEDPPDAPFERPPRHARARAIAFVAITAVAGFAGWHVGRAQSETAQATAPEPSAPRSRITTVTIAAPPPPPIIETEPVPTTPATSVAAPPSKPHAAPTSDPLTL